MAAQRASATGAAKKTAAKRTPARRAAKKTAKKVPEQTKVPERVDGVNEPGRSLMMVRIGGHEYPQVISKSCHTCQSPHRRWIENELTLGRSYNSIANRLLDMPAGHMPHPSRTSLPDHVKHGHMPTPNTVRREIIDREAERLGKTFSGESLVNHRVANEMVIQRGYERLLAGDIDVSTENLIQAIGAQQRIEAQMDSEGFDLEAMQQALMVYLELAEHFIPRESMAAYGAAISKHPIIRALRARQVAEAQSGEDEESDQRSA